MKAGTLRSILLAVAAASLATAVALLVSADMNGYELDAYGAAPPITWVAWGAALAATWAVLCLRPRDSEACAAGALFLAAGLFLVRYSTLTGMALPDGGDMATHAGWIVDIGRTGTFDDNLYPAMHVWAVTLASLADVGPVEVLTGLHLPIMFLVYALASGGLARALVPFGSPAFRFAIGVGLATLPIVAQHFIVATTGGWVFLLLPFILLAVVRSTMEQSRRWPWALIAAAMAALLGFAHPLGSLTLVALLAAMAGVHMVMRRRTRRRTPATAYGTLLLITLVSSLSWTLSQRVGVREFQRIYFRFVEADPGRPSAAGVQARTSELGFSPLEVLQYGAFEFLPAALLAGFAIVGFLAIAGRAAKRESLVDLPATLGLAFASLLLFTFAGASLVLQDFGLRGGRLFFYSLAGILPMAAAGAGLWLRDRPPLRATALGIVLLMVALATLGAMKSPPTHQAWDAVPPSELAAAGWVFEHKDPSKVVYIGPAAGNYRYAHLVYGSEGVEALRPDLQRYFNHGGGLTTNFPKVPDHFDFTSFATEACRPGPAERALVFLPAGEILPYLSIWQRVDRFEASDIDAWEGGGSGGRVYDSGPAQARIYVAPPC